MLRKCPRCRKYTFSPAGQVKAGTRLGRRRVFACKNCSYRSIV